MSVAKRAGGRQELCPYAKSRYRDFRDTAALETRDGVISPVEIRMCQTRADFPLLMTSRCLSGCPECMNITHRRSAEESFVLPIELAGTLIPNLEGCARGIEFLREHLLTRSVKPKLLLKLQRAHGCEAAEVMVEGRPAHPTY